MKSVRWELVAALTTAGMSFPSAAHALVASYTDLWDVSQGTVVTGTSGALSGGWWSDPRNMFGGTYGSVADTKNSSVRQW
jgi:hypothetical protein